MDEGVLSAAAAHHEHAHEASGWCGAGAGRRFRRPGPTPASLLGPGTPGKGWQRQGPPGRPPRQIDFWYTRNAAVASQPQTNVNRASQPSRVSTTDQSGLAASASRPAPTAHSTGL